MRPSPSIVPRNERDVYLVMDDFGRIGCAWRETTSTKPRENIIRDLLAGEYHDPVRVIVFNTQNGKSRDVSAEIVYELIERTADRPDGLPECLGNFADRHVGRRCQIQLSYQSLDSLTSIALSAQMRNASKLKLVSSTYCAQYESGAAFYIDESDSSGDRKLIVVYDHGGYDGAPQFVAGIPSTWTEGDVQDLLRWPMKDPDAPYPPWEVPERAFGSSMLFAWWHEEPSQEC